MTSEWVKGSTIVGVRSDNTHEYFTVIKVCRKYVYLKSAEYGSDGYWRCLKSDVPYLCNVSRY